MFQNYDLMCCLNKRIPDVNKQEDNIPTNYCNVLLVLFSTYKSIIVDPDVGCLIYIAIYMAASIPIVKAECKKLIDTFSTSEGTEIFSALI